LSPASFKPLVSSTSGEAAALLPAAAASEEFSTLTFSSRFL